MALSNHQVSHDGFGQTLWDDARFAWRAWRCRKQTVTWRQPTAAERALYDQHSIVGRFGNTTHAIAEVDGRVWVLRDRDFYGWPDPPHWAFFVLDAAGAIWSATDCNVVPRCWSLWHP